MQTVTVSVRIPPSIKDRLDDVADGLGVTKGALIESFLLEGLERLSRGEECVYVAVEARKMTKPARLRV